MKSKTRSAQCLVNRPSQIKRQERMGGWIPDIGKGTYFLFLIFLCPELTFGDTKCMREHSSGQEEYFKKENQEVGGGERSSILRIAFHAPPQPTSCSSFPFPLHFLSPGLTFRSPWNGMQCMVRDRKCLSSFLLFLSLHPQTQCAGHEVVTESQSGDEKEK